MSPSNSSSLRWPLQELLICPKTKTKNLCRRVTFLIFYRNGSLPISLASLSLTLSTKTLCTLRGSQPLGRFRVGRPKFESQLCLLLALRTWKAFASLSVHFFPLQRSPLRKFIPGPK